MRDHEAPKRTWAIGLAGVAAVLFGTACLTPWEMRSVADQAEDARRQADRVSGQQERLGEAIQTVQPMLSRASRPLEYEREPPSPVAAAVTGIPETDLPELQPLEGDEPEAAPALPGSPPLGDASREALYRAGYLLYHRGDLEAAEQYLSRFIAADPANPLADDAQYWIGECRFARGRYREAIREFSVVIDSYPVGDRVADALYRIARCHERLGDETQMRSYLSAVLERFPESDLAPLARAALQEP